jgi:hypothetical protein
MKNYELLGNILIKHIQANIEFGTEPFYFENTNSIKLRTLKPLAIYAVLQFLKIKNYTLKIEDFEEFAEYEKAKLILENTKLADLQLINSGKYTSIKQDKCIFNSKCYKKQSLGQQIRQRQIKNKDEMDR